MEGSATRERVSKEPPASLRTTQGWFAEVIRQPIAADNRLHDDRGATDYIRPSPTLEAGQRIELYHQQYWWRLLRCLQENFPTLTRHLGHEGFNQEIGVPYLNAHPPTHWALCRLGETLAQFLTAPLLKHLAEIDWATNHAFWASEEGNPLKEYIHLFALDQDLFAYREQLLAGMANPPITDKRGYYVIYRSPEKQVCWKELTEEQYTLLTLIQQTHSIEEACDTMEETITDPEQVAFWFKDWASWGWFA